MASTAINVVESSRHYMRNGRALATSTHNAEIAQAYFIAYLVLRSLGMRANPTNPYAAYKNQKPFGTFGGPDIAATLGTVAKAALNAAWYQKWIVHLRPRPEAGAGLVHLVLTKPPGSPLPQAPVNEVVLDQRRFISAPSRAWEKSFSVAGLPGRFADAPVLPGRPGHGRRRLHHRPEVFFRRRRYLPASGYAVDRRVGARALHRSGKSHGQGELHKLAHNMSFGHGIHAGINWRSDTDQSIVLGEQVALRFLQDQVFSYSEKVKVTITLLNGDQFTITHQ